MDSIGLLVVTILAVIFVTPYLYMHISAMRTVSKPVQLDNQIAVSNANLELTVYFYFMSKTCSMCKSMTPVIEAMAANNPNVILVDINNDPKLAKNFPVYGTPTLMAINKGIIKKVKLGSLSTKKIAQFIKESDIS